MKNRFIGIILVIALLLASMVMGFSAVVDTATLTIKTTVQGVNEIGLFDAKVTSKGAFAAGSNTKTWEFLEIDPAGSATKSTGKIYLAIRTNNKSGFEVAVAPSTLTNGTDTMGYKLIFDAAHGNEAKTMVVNDTNNTHELTVAGSTGLTIYNFPFQVNITPAQYSLGVPNTTYTATITFKLTAN